jgi:DNA-binding response OmpR family regulator
MPGERILVVEDEAAVARGLRYGLEQEGFDVTWAASGEEALAAVPRHEPHLVLLDVRLPGLSGFDVCRRLRADGRRLPILMLTARDDETDRVLGLELGADDYVVKPFGLREVVARVRALLRRAYGELAERGERVVCGDLEIDLARLQVRRGAEVVDLTPTELRLLCHLARQPGRAFSRAQLIEAVWGYDGDVDSERTVDVHVRHLRAKLEDDAAVPRRIVTVRGVGYRLDA